MSSFKFALLPVYLEGILWGVVDSPANKQNINIPYYIRFRPDYITEKQIVGF